MDQILRTQINQLLNNKDLKTLKNMKADKSFNVSIQDLWVVSTLNGFYMEYIKFLNVSNDEIRIWGIHLTEAPKCWLMMKNFKTQESISYDYEHGDFTLALMIAENLNFVMTGRLDKKMVLHNLQTGRVLKIIDFGTNEIRCLFRLGSVVAVAKKKEVVFYDLISQELMDLPPVKVKCRVSCMQE